MLESVESFSFHDSDFSEEEQENLMMDPEDDLAGELCKVSESSEEIFQPPVSLKKPRNRND